MECMVNHLYLKTLQVWSLQVSWHDDTHYKLHAQWWTTRPGDVIEFVFIVRYNAAEPHVIGIQINGVNSCGEGGGGGDGNICKLWFDFSMLLQTLLS